MLYNEKDWGSSTLVRAVIDWALNVESRIDARIAECELAMGKTHAEMVELYEAGELPDTEVTARWRVLGGYRR